VDNSTFAAEYGRNSGAIVNFATRWGTNQFSGEAFEFYRNDPDAEVRGVRLHIRRHHEHLVPDGRLGPARQVQFAAKYLF